MKPKKILVVDDSVHDVELMLVALEEQNLANEVVVAHDGVEALDYFYRRGFFADRPSELPAVVFLDLKMPKVDGMEVLRQVKADPDLKRIPIVILTSSREEEDLLKSYDLNANAYVIKPVVFTSFIEVIKQLGLFWVLTNERPSSNGQSNRE